MVQGWRCGTINRFRRLPEDFFFNRIPSVFSLFSHAHSIVFVSLTPSAPVSLSLWVCVRACLFLSPSLSLPLWLYMFIYFIRCTMHRTCIRRGGFIGYTSAENLNRLPTNPYRSHTAETDDCGGRTCRRTERYALNRTRYFLCPLIANKPNLANRLNVCGVRVRVNTQKKKINK